jgi:hypothetical protein
LKIGAPTVMGVGFAKYVGLKCSVVEQRKTISGHWVTRTRHGKKVKVKTRARHKIVKVTKCRPKTKRVRVVVRVPLRHQGKVVRRHGKIVYRKKVEHKRVAVTPHWKSKAKEHVRHEHATSVSGWLGFSDGTALAGQPVQILTTPDNGLGQFAVSATATTAANGTWTADLPANLRESSRLLRRQRDDRGDRVRTGHGDRAGQDQAHERHPNPGGAVTNAPADPPARGGSLPDRQRARRPLTRRRDHRRIGRHRRRSRERRPAQRVDPRSTRTAARPRDPRHDRPARAPRRPRVTRRDPLHARAGRTMTQRARCTIAPGNPGVTTRRIIAAADRRADPGWGFPASPAGPRARGSEALATVMETLNRVSLLTRDLV